MIRIFMRSPLPNSLAVLVLIALLITWITSLVLTMSETRVKTDKGWYAWLLPVFSLLGLPALADLLQTSGVTLLYAAVVLVVLLLNIIIPVVRMRDTSSNPLVNEWPRWSVLISALGGLAVAGYLSFVEVIGGQVSCGPSGGCDTVQHSRYAVLFGVLPVAYLGLIGYIGILAAWVAWQFGPTAIKRMAPVAIWAMCLFGALFSIYLTFLEPFVIGATCMWCITSAVLMIDLLLVSTPAAREALALPDEEAEFQEA